MLYEGLARSRIIHHSKFKKNCGQEWIRTTEVERQRIYSPPHLAALEPAQFKSTGCGTYKLIITTGQPITTHPPEPVSRRRGSNPRPADYKSAALPAELLRLLIL